MEDITEVMELKKKLSGRCNCNDIVIYPPNDILSEEEEKDVTESLKEIDSGKCKLFNNVEDMIKELNDDDEVNHV